MFTITPPVITPAVVNHTPPVVDQTGRLLIGDFVGAVELVVDEYVTYEGRELVTELALLYQLITGEFVVTYDIPDGKTPHKVFSLKGSLYTIHWGFYPLDFPEEWKTRRSCPKALSRYVF